MLVRVVKMQFKEAHLPAFLSHFEDVKWQVAKFEGCQGMQLLQDANDPCTVFTYSIWHSQQDLENYRTSALFCSIWPKIKPWFAQKAEAWSLNQHFNGFISQKIV